MIWDAITAISSVISMVAFVLTAVYIRDQLRGQQKDRYLAITSDLYSAWQAADFMEAQLWLLHKLEEADWPGFVANHRGGVGEVAFHRVGSFYDRVGTLIRLGFVDGDEILATVGGYAIAVWGRIGPLVYEARGIEHSTLFIDFERMLPACHECYVPNLAKGAEVVPFAVDQPEPRVSVAAVRRRVEDGERLTLLDVRLRPQVTDASPVLPGTVFLPFDEVGRRAGELPGDVEVVALCA